MIEPTAGVRERPASIDYRSSVDQTRATARYLGARIARLLGVDEIPVDDLNINWAPLGPKAAGKYTPAPGVGELRAGEPGITLERTPTWSDPTVTLAHELAHAYLLTNEGARDSNRWIHESMADYVAAKIGFAGLKVDASAPEPGETAATGYTKGARFLAWLEERQPRAAEGWLKLVARGVGTPEENFRAVTKTPLPLMLAIYEQEPYIEEPTASPFARMLRVRRNLLPLGRTAFDYYLSRSQMVKDNAPKMTPDFIGPPSPATQEVAKATKPATKQPTTEQVIDKRTR